MADKDTTLTYTGEQVQDLLDKVNDGKPATDSEPGFMQPSEKKQLDKLSKAKLVGYKVISED
jgi:hypothetical protein